MAAFLVFVDVVEIIPGFPEEGARSQSLFALYNPALLPPDLLLAEFTARRPLLATLLGIVRGNAPGQPPRHCPLLGARGMGNTTKLSAIAHRVNRDVELASQWQPVVFDEEKRRVGNLADFWLEAIRHLALEGQHIVIELLNRLFQPPSLPD